MSRNKKLYSLIFFIVLSLFLIIFGSLVYRKLVKSIKEDDNGDVKLITITNFEIEESSNFNGEYYIMKVGENFTPTFKYEPSNLSEYQKKFIWTNSDITKLKVDHNNTFTALKPGTVNLIATSTKNSELSRNIKVKIVEKENKIEFDKTLISKVPVFSVGQVAYLNHTIEGEISLYDFKWTSSDNSVVTVDSGYIKGISSGSAVITLTSTYDESYSASIPVKIMGRYTTEKVKKVIFNDNVSITLPTYTATVDIKTFLREKNQVGYIIEMSAKTDVDGASTTHFKFEDESMVKIIENSNSKVKFEILKEGKIKLYGVSSYFPEIEEEFEFNAFPFIPNDTFNLKSPDSTLFTIENTKSVLKMIKSEVIPLIVECNKKEIANNDLVISSSDENVVKVLNGVIYAVGEGSVTVTINHVNGELKKLSFDVLVLHDSSKDYIPSSFIEVNDELINSEIKISSFDTNVVNCGDTAHFRFSLYPIFSTNKDLNISFSNPDIVNYKITKEELYLTLDIEFLNIGYTELFINSLENENLSLYYDFEVVNKKDVSFTYQVIDVLERGEQANCNVLLDKSLKGVEVTYVSSNPDIVSVGLNGELVGLNYGTSNIIINATDGKTSYKREFMTECVKEESLYDALTSFKANALFDGKLVNLNEKLFFIGDTFSLNVSFEPSNHPFGKYHDVIISDESVLTVVKTGNTYNFTTISSGTTHITLYPYANSSLTLEYDVRVANIMPEFMYVSIPSDVVYVGDKYQFGYLVDWRATYKDVDVIISDPNVCYMEDDYLVITKKGDATITFLVTDNDENSVSYTTSIKISAKEHSPFVKIERYGVLNFIMRMAFQLLASILLGVIVYILSKEIKLSLNDYLLGLIFLSGGIILLSISFVFRKLITGLNYEKYDYILNLVSFVISFGVSFLSKKIIKKKKQKDK